MSGALDYKSAGVDTRAADEAKARMKSLVESTFTSGTRGRFGGFGGMFRMPLDVKQPVLVASADGVGTKVKVAIETGRHDTIGHDLVNHCVNDILVQGAHPLFFLDYLAFGVLEPTVAEAVVRGVAAGCRENACALIGGETAEMAGVYIPPDYDLAGFVVGYVEEDRVLGPERVRAGNVLVALASSGLHTNGYSLARRVVSERMSLGVDDLFPGEEGTVGEVLLQIHRSYLGSLTSVLGRIHAMAHITGGGIQGNLSRVLPENVDAVVNTASWTVPNVFSALERAGEISRGEMFHTFNMGVGMVVVTDVELADSVMASARAAGVESWLLGHTIAGAGHVLLN